MSADRTSNQCGDSRLAEIRENQKVRWTLGIPHGGNAYSQASRDIEYLLGLLDARRADETPDVELRALREHIAWAWSIIASAGRGDWLEESPDWREAAEKWYRARDPYGGLAVKTSDQSHRQPIDKPPQ